MYECIICTYIQVFVLFVVCLSAGDADFVSVAREIQFEAGQRRVCVAIDVVDDRVMERTEDLLVFVESDPMNGILIEGLSIAPAVTDICITDNDSELINNKTSYQLRASIYIT